MPLSNSATPCTAACLPYPSTISWSLLKLMSVELVMPSNHLILCYPFLLLPSIFPSIRVFLSDLALCITWPNYWSFIFNISPSNEYSGLISFKIDRFDLLAVQGTLKSLFQHHSVKAWILWHSVFFIVQHSHPYMTTRKAIALTIRTCEVKVMSLLFNMLSMRQALGPGALGRPRGIGWRGRWEGGSGWGTHVNPWLFHFNV